MKGRREDKQLEAELAAILGPRFPGMTITTGHDDRWDRKCATFRWSGFNDLLPEERFRRLVSVIPDGFRTSRMSGVVWLELAPDETVEEYLRLPRSEDVADKQRDVYTDLIRVGFFDLLGKELGPSPETRCAGDFTLSAAVLSEGKCSADKIRDAKLTFIRHGVYCDCQVIPGAQPALAKLHAGAA